MQMLALRIATIVSVLISALKFAESLLDDRQKRQVQEFIDKVTLFLIDIDVIRHYDRFTKWSFQAKYYAAISGVLLLFWFVYYSFLGPDVSLHRAFITLRFQALATVVLFIPYCVVSSWLARSGSIRTYIAKSASVVIGLYAPALLLLFYDPDDYFSGDSMHIFEAVAVCWAWVLTIFALTLLLGLAFQVFRLAVWLLTRLMYRISTDVKGAWAALLFITTGILTIIQSLVK